MEQRNQSRDELREELRREFIADYYELLDDNEYVDDPYELVDTTADWESLPDIAREDYGEYIEEKVEEIGIDDMKPDDLRNDTLGISGMLMRGLDAESTIDAAEFFNIKSWLEDRGTLYGSDYVGDDEIPTFEEWQAEMFGPGEPSGPEEEARRLARYHREVAGNAEAPEPYDFFDVGEDVMEEMERQSDEIADTDPDGRAATGDYDLSENEQHIDMTFEDMEDIPESLDASPEDGDDAVQTESDAD